MTTLAFHSDPATKRKFLCRAIEHRRADLFRQGHWWDGGHGCHWGCLSHGEPRCVMLGNTDRRMHVTAGLMGVPMVLAHLQERIFELIPSDLAPYWSESLIDSIPVGADLSRVHHRIALHRLVGEHGVIQHADDRGRAAIERVAECHRAAIAGSDTSEMWSEAWSAARSGSAVRSGSAARSAGACCSAACSARSDASRSAASAAAWSAAWAEHWLREAHWMIVECAAAPVPGREHAPDITIQGIRAVECAC